MRRSRGGLALLTSAVLASACGASNIDTGGTTGRAAGITVTPSDALSTTEAGGTATFTIVLDTAPTADVTVPLSSSDTAEGELDVAQVIFTPLNWNAPQTITITGVDDAVADGDHAYTVVTAAAISDDDAYDGVDAVDVAIANVDNESPGITVAAAPDLATSEAGATATFTIALNSQPSADVTIALASSDAGEGTAEPGEVVFTPVNWNAPQTITITGVDDAGADGEVAYQVVTQAAVSTDATYAGLDADDVALVNTDNDSAGVTVAPTAGLVTTEAGGTATFTIVLNSQPSASVRVDLSSSDPGEATIDTPSVTFSTVNWNAPQTVTVTGQNDAIADGNQPFQIVTAPAVSDDATYAGLDADDVAASNTDDDSAGITVTPTSGLVTTESGGTATFTIVLNSQPSAQVTIALSSSDPGEGTVSPAQVVFSTSNWNTPKTVTVTGVNDDLVDGSQPYTIVTAAATSADAGYVGRNADNVAVQNSDNDTPAITVTPTSGLVTTESGGTATFTVSLNAQPTADVTIALSSSDPGEGTVSPAQVVFTMANWQTPKTVTVTGVDDGLVDGNQPYTIVTAAATSADARYAGQNPANVAVTNTDNDSAPSTSRGVTNPQVLFDGTETQLSKYGLYNQSSAGGSISMVADPLGQQGTVLRFSKPKADDWTHVMVRLTDKRTNYQDPAQVEPYEKAYHFKVKMYVADDPQYSNAYMNLGEDFHCEPCEANNLQLYTGYLEDDSVCMWVAYSTNQSFDPRGLNRGSSFDPWPTVSGNRTNLTMGADGYATNLPMTMPQTGSILLCRDDLTMSDLRGRWVDFEMLIKSSSFASGQIKVWIDEKPYFYDGPNSYRWNQTGPASSSPLAVNTFQWGLYGGRVNVQANTPAAWVFYSTPPRLETGDDIVTAP